MTNCLLPIRTTYDDYWRFAAERQNIYERRLRHDASPWTQDPILATYRFTNAFRASDRVSQYLIREVQYGEGRSSDPREVFFRTILFKIFNKVETWELLEARHGPLRVNTGLDSIQVTLDGVFASGQRIYSAAYIMPAPNLGEKRKHVNHLRLLDKMMTDGLPHRLANTESLKEAYEILLAEPGLGPFLAFQYAIDLNYSSLMDHDENEFVVAGPGAQDGIAKCFDMNKIGLFNNAEDLGIKSLDPELSMCSHRDIINHMVDIQDREFARLGLNFSGLFGRKLHAIDCQNLFCEISKYARVKYPDVHGTNGRLKIKQNFRQHADPMPQPFFPPKWNLTCSL